MARGSNTAQTAANSAQGVSNQAGAAAGSLFSTLTPELLNESANPQGFAPADLAAMNTASQESAGGSESAAVGQGALQAARTHNLGTPNAAIGQSVRQAGTNLSNSALRTQIMNAQEKNKERQSGIGGLENLYGTELNTELGGLGQVANNVNANTNAANASYDWAKDFLDPLMGSAARAPWGLLSGTPSSGGGGG